MYIHRERERSSGWTGCATLATATGWSFSPLRRAGGEAGASGERVGGWVKNKKHTNNETRKHPKKNTYTYDKVCKE